MLIVFSFPCGMLICERRRGLHSMLKDQTRKNSQYRIVFGDSCRKRCSGNSPSNERCVVKFNRDQLKEEYDKVVNDIKTTIKYASKPVDVNYDCNEIIYYVDDSTEFMDFAYAHVTLTGGCMLIQAYAGIPHDERKLTLKFIYQSTGEVMFELHITNDNSDASLTKEEFEEKLEEMKQGEHK